MPKKVKVSITIDPRIASQIDKIWLEKMHDVLKKGKTKAIPKSQIYEEILELGLKRYKKQ